MTKLDEWLRRNGNTGHYLFSTADFRALFPSLSDAALKTMLARTVRRGPLQHVCRGLYTYLPAIPADGFFLFHVAAYLRANHFNYVSQETVLSEAGLISQVPINWICIMSSGRSSKITCSHWGTIAFIHTTRNPRNLIKTTNL